MMSPINPFLHVCFGPTGAINCPPQPDDPAWVIANIHQRLQLAIEMTQHVLQQLNSLTVTPATVSLPGHFMAALDHLAIIDKTLPARTEIPREECLYPLVGNLWVEIVGTPQ
jgi:hypothetical protein